MADPVRQSRNDADGSALIRSVGEAVVNAVSGGAAAESGHPAATLAVFEGRRNADWQTWIGAVVAVRDVIGRVPPLPVGIWLAGASLIGGAMVVGVVRFRRLMHAAVPATTPVVEMVGAASRSLGMRHVPRVLMIDRRVSPMVWCGASPKLVLPTPLWSELDEPGRLAVVLHELAHIRRRDHWVLWWEKLIGTLYWWHPVVWWVRRRLEAEADNCCDAWVVAMQPRMRRTYAEALLRTRQYLGEGRSSIPAWGMGATSGRAKRFARRLTMVMTGSTKPGASIPGVAMVLLMATVGWMASPARSCPPKEGEAKHGTPCPEARPERVEAGISVIAPRVDVAVTPKPQIEVRPRIAPSISVRSLMPVGDKNVDEKKLAALEARLAELGEQIEHLTRSIHSGSSASDDDEDDADDDDDADASPHRHVQAPKPPKAPKPPRAPKGMMAPTPPVPPVPPVGAVQPVPPMPPKHRHPGPGAMVFGHPGPHPAPPPPGMTWVEANKDMKVESRTYRFTNPGKLEDFMKFMSRNDVPVRVQGGDGGIGIEATPEQHNVFNAFFQLVDPSDERADAMSGFMGFAVGLGRAWTDGGSAGGVGCGPCCSHKADCKKCGKVLERRERAEVIREDARRMANEFRAQAEGETARARAEAREMVEGVRGRLRQDARRIRAEAGNQQEMIDALRRQADELREQGDRIREQAEQLRERMNDRKERHHERTEGVPAREAIDQYLEAMQRAAAALEFQAEEVNPQLEVLEAQIAAVEADEEELGAHADEVEGRAEAIEQMYDSLGELAGKPELTARLSDLARELESAEAPEADEDDDEALEMAASAASNRASVIDLGRLEELIQNAAEQAVEDQSGDDDSADEELPDNND